ncbi:MAG: MFS transporter [Anaerolineae bacterium]|nr:MFS transporter [Anaerolineae bacterium]
MSLTEQAQKSYQKIVNAWCMYDWGSSAFSTTIEAAVLPAYFSVIAQDVLTPSQSTAYWGYTNSLSLLVAALLAPILGSIADYTGGKKRFLTIFATIGVIATALMFFVDTGTWLLALILFFFGSTGLGASYIFSDALLPHVAKEEDVDQVSSKGYALGYVGGGILLAVNIAMIWFLPGNWGYRLSLLSAGIWWAIFTIPLLRWVPEPPANTVGIGPGVNPVVAGFKRLGGTFRDMRKYRELFKFLIAFWLYNDGIGTIIKMSTIYGAEIGIDTLSMVGALLLTQFVGIPFSLLFGKFGKKIGTKRAVMLGLGWYALLTVVGYFMTAAWQFWVLAFGVGMVQGGTQALSRSLYSQMAPKARSAEFFGFYDVSSKFAGIIGPLLFGVLAQSFGESRLSILAMTLFFIVGIFLLSNVDEEEGMRLAAEENALAAAAGTI